MATKGRSVEFSVKARDEYSKEFRKLEAQQQKLSAASRAASRRDLVGTAKAEVQAAADNYKRLAAEVERYRAAQAALAQSGNRSSRELAELGETIALTRDRSRQAMVALQQKRAALNQIVGSATTGYSAFNRIATAMEMGSTAARQEATAINAISPQIKKLTNDSNAAANAQKNLKTQLNSSAAAIQRQRMPTTNARGEKQEVTAFGLKPWQLTNLGYQVNDVVSGLAMGQRPLQVFAQQAGQLAQIWPGVMVALAKGIPIIAGVTAALSPFIAAALRMREASESLNYFQKQLAVSADGSNYSAKGLADITARITELGIASEDARKLVSGFVKQGIKASEFQQYAEMAKQLDAITGDGIVDSGEKISKALSGTSKTVRELDEELNFLTADQLESIYAMEKSGDKAGALALAQDALASRLKAAREESTNWTEAMKAMGEAWDSLVTIAQNTGLIDWMAKEWNQFGKDIEKGAKDTKRQIETLRRFINRFKSSDSLTLSDLDERIAETRRQLENSNAGSIINSFAKAELEQLLAIRREIIASIKDEGLLVDANTVKTEERKKSELDIRATLQQRLASMKEEVRLAGLTERERYIEKGLLELKNDIMKEGNKTEAEALAILQGKTEEYRKQLGLMYDQQESAKNYTQITSNSSNVVDKIIGIESGGKANAKNPNSSATGLGQFIESTWLSMFKKYFPDRAAGMSREAILALRNNAEISRKMVELYVRENAAILKQAGVATTDAALYLAHFLGPQGAISIMTAKVNTPVTELLSSGQINANKSILQGKTAGQVQQWAAKKMGISDPEVQTLQTLDELDQKRLKTEKEYQTEYQKRVKQQEFELTLASKTARDAAVAKALREEELKAKEAGLQLSKEQRAEIEKLAKAEFDQKNANLEVNQLMEQRKLLLESFKIAQDTGNADNIASLSEQITQVESKLNTAIQKAIEFWKAIGGPGAQTAILQLQTMQAGIGKTVDNLETKFLPKAAEINERLADIGSNAFSSFAQAIANGENAAEAFFNSLLQGIAEFLIEIGKAIVKQALFNALTGGGGASGGTGGGISGFIGGLFGIGHDGALIGQSASTKFVNPAVFAGAQRYHGGGVIGTHGKQEVPFIGLKDEEVLSLDDPRHINNMRRNGAGGSAVNLKNVNVFDPTDVLEHSLSTVEGERVMLNYLTRNARKVSSAING